MYDVPGEADGVGSTTNLLALGGDNFGSAIRRALQLGEKPSVSSPISYAPHNRWLTSVGLRSHFYDFCTGGRSALALRLLLGRLSRQVEASAGVQSGEEVCPHWPCPAHKGVRIDSN